MCETNLFVEWLSGSKLDSLQSILDRCALFFAEGYFHLCKFCLIPLCISELLRLPTSCSAGPVSWVRSPLGSGLLSGWYFPKLQPPPPPPRPIFGVSSSRQSSNGRFRHSRVRQGPVVQANLTLTSIWSKIDVINFAKSAFLQPINVFKPTPLEKFSLLIS